MKEWVLALELERRYTKAEILEMYLNVVPWGNAVGIRAAAEAYFGKDPAALTLAEGLYLASLIPAPNARYQDPRGAPPHAPGPGRDGPGGLDYGGPGGAGLEGAA